MSASPSSSQEFSSEDERSLPPVVTDPERLRVLRRYDILDTEPESSFDTITELAADLFDIPVAVVSFIDAERQWVKSRVGEHRRQIGLEHSFCVHVIEQGTVSVVEDLSEDPRFRDNPFVTEEGFRFYAGVPLMAPGGHPIGTLCLLDTAPRSEPDQLRERLPKLASLVVDELELRRESDRRQRAAQRYETLFEEAGEAILVHDDKGNILRSNQKANEVFGRSGEDLSSKTLFDLHPEDSHEVPRQKLKALREGRDYQVVTEYIGGDGRQFWGTLTATTVEVGGETVMRSLVRDVTERRRSERLRRMQTHLLEKIAHGAPTSEVLPSLAQFVEGELPLAAASILTVENNRLRHAASPSLPEEFTSFIDGTEVGPGVGSCGTAAFTAEAVVTEDIQEDERWIGYREAAVRAGVRSCWSYPIVGSDDTVLGAFGTYRAEPGRPSRWERRLLHQVSHVASIALEKDRRQAALQKNQQLLQLSQELASVGGWEYDAETDALRWTDETYRIHGLPAGTEVSLEKAISFYAPATQPAIRQAFFRLLEAGESFDLELQLKTAEGEQRWVRAIAAREETGDEGRRLRGAVQNITDQKETEQALRAKNGLLQTIFDEAPVMIALFDEDGTPQFVNRCVETKLGWTQADLEKDPELLRRLFPEPKLWQKALRFIREAPGEWREFPVRTKSGDVKHMQVTTSQLPDGQRIGIGMDVTEKKEREERLRLLEAAIEHSKVPVLITEAETLDPPGPSIVYANPAFTEVTGYSREEIQGKSPRFLQGEETDREALDRIRQAMKEEESVREVVLNYGKDGTPYWNDIYIAPIKNESGEVTHFVSIQQDVTERVRRREELKEAKEAAEEASRIKSALLSNMNHEFRTPLTAIISFAELVSNEPALAETFADRILGGGERLLYTLNTVMDFAELEGKGVSLSPQRVDVADVASSVAGGFRDEARRKDLYLKEEVDERVVITSDAHCIERICTHLLSNAVKFTEEGGVTVRVRAEGATAVLEVVDTGIGIPPEAQTKVFDEFFQASTGNDRSHDGNGLGLTVVKRLLDRIGGSIALESTPEERTQVTVQLPPMPTDSH